MIPGIDAGAAPSARLLAGDHACWFFGSRREHRAGVTAFLRHGLQRDGKVLYLADTIPVEGVADDLCLAGLDPDRLVASGQLVLRAPDPSDDPADEVARYRELVGQARAEGWCGGLWITGEGTPGLHAGDRGTRRYLDYERLVERFLAGTQDARSLCQYRLEAAAGHADVLRSLHNLELSGQAGPRPLARSVPGLSTVPRPSGLAVAGEVDVATWATLANALRRAVEATGGTLVVLDLAGLRFIDGHGVALIVEAARALDPPRRLLLRGAPRSLLRIADVLRLEREPGIVVELRGGDGGR
jgi:anti-anti-sigma factor